MSEAPRKLRPLFEYSYITTEMAFCFVQFLICLLSNKPSFIFAESNLPSINQISIFKTFDSASKRSFRPTKSKRGYFELIHWLFAIFKIFDDPIFAIIHFRQNYMIGGYFFKQTTSDVYILTSFFIFRKLCHSDISSNHKPDVTFHWFILSLSQRKPQSESLCSISIPHQENSEQLQPRLASCAFV